MQCIISKRLFYLQGTTLIREYMTYNIYNWVQDEINHPFQNFKNAVVEIWE